MKQWKNETTLASIRSCRRIKNAKMKILTRNFYSKSMPFDLTSILLHYSFAIITLFSFSLFMEQVSKVLYMTLNAFIMFFNMII